MPNNQASGAYPRLAFEQFDAPPPAPEPPVELVPQASLEPEAGAEQPADDGPLEIAPGVQLPTLEEIERIQSEAHREGYALGYEEGSARGRMEAAELHQLLQSMDDAMERLDQEIAEEVQVLAIEIARQVLRETLALRPDVVLGVVREALSQLPQKGAVIHVNPEDLELMRRFVAEHYEAVEHRVVEDATVERGGCLIESAGGQIDAQIQTRWRRVVETLTRDAGGFHES
ncbi:MAG: hypothetical protein BSR46_12085 [Candidatus Dactylopiibacterium carminicum]|nr:MAG: hypothetical protein BSR46_12085 [Candidatus Dactylopiibacterium carminicum]